MPYETRDAVLEAHKELSSKAREWRLSDYNLTDGVPILYPSIGSIKFYISGLENKRRNLSEDISKEDIYPLLTCIVSIYASELNSTASIIRDVWKDAFDEISESGREVMDRKNHDYTDGDQGEDPFKNFRVVEELGICSSEKGILVRLMDKVSRIETFLSGEGYEVEDEKFKDTVVDFYNYTVLFFTCYKSNQR